MIAPRLAPGADTGVEPRRLPFAVVALTLAALGLGLLEGLGLGLPLAFLDGQLAVQPQHLNGQHRIPFVLCRLHHGYELFARGHDRLNAVAGIEVVDDGEDVGESIGFR